MDFSFDEIQEMLRRTAHDLLSIECPKILIKKIAEDEKGYPMRLWHKMADLGWLGIIIPEKYGGTGARFIDLVVLLEQMGHFRLLGPFFPTAVLGTLVILKTESKGLKEELLPKIAKGELMLTLALTENSGCYDAGAIETKAIANGDDYIITGTKLFVPDAHLADYIICVTKTKKHNTGEDGVTLFLVDRRSPGITCTLLKTLTGDKQYEVIFDGVRVPRNKMLGELNHGWAVIDTVLRQAAVAKCAEMVGGAERILEMTVDYTKQRKQFGHPIGSFQAIQHYCANMVTDIDVSRYITYEAAWKISEGLSYKLEAAMAKNWVSEMYQGITVLAHQILGGVAHIEDHDFPLYYKQAKASEVCLGDADFHREMIARELLD